VSPTQFLFAVEISKLLNINKRENVNMWLFHTISKVFFLLLQSPLMNVKYIVLFLLQTRFRISTIFEFLNVFVLYLGSR